MTIKACYKCGAPSLLSHKDGLCFAHAKEQEQQREEARKRPLCKCGNMTRKGETKCGRCLDKQHRLEYEAAIREEELDAAMTKVVRREVPHLLRTIAELNIKLREQTERADGLERELRQALLSKDTPFDNWDTDPAWDNHKGDN